MSSIRAAAYHLIACTSGSPSYTYIRAGICRALSAPETVKAHIYPLALKHRIRVRCVRRVALAVHDQSVLPQSLRVCISFQKERVDSGKVGDAAPVRLANKP